MDLLLVGEWVPHGGLPTCITVPKDFRPRNNQHCDATSTRNRISRKSEKTHESGHLHLQPLSWSILSWVKVQTGWGYCRCTLSYLIISQIKPSDIHPFNWVSSNTENKSFPWVCTGIDRHIWSQTHDSISSDRWDVKQDVEQDVEQDVKQDVDERWSGREQTIDSHRRPLRGLLPFFTNKKLSYIIAPLFHWSLIFSLNCLNDEKVFCSGGTFCFCLHWQLSPQGTHASKLQ